MTNRAGQEHWNRVYVDEEPQIIPKMNPIRAWIEAYIPNAEEKNNTCIEIGCYPGRFLSVFGELGYELYGTWIQPLSATLGFEDLRRVFKCEAFSRAFIEPVFDLC